MPRKMRSPLTVGFLLLGSIGFAIYQVHQFELNQDLLHALPGYRLPQSDETRTRCSLKALAALNAGADPNCGVDIDEAGAIKQPSWHDAVPLKLWPFGRQWFGNHARMSALKLAVKSNNDPLPVKALLDRGADMHMTGNRNPDTTTMLADAIHPGGEAIIKLLLDHGADINERQYGPSGTSSLFSTLHTHFDTGSATPLMIAVIGFDPDIVRLLIKRGADVSLTTKEGMSALDLALQFENPDHSDKNRGRIIQILKAAGAKK